MKFDIIGDIHGCYDELIQLIQKLGYSAEQNLWVHPEKRKLVFLGDLTDRGPDSIKTIELVYSLVHAQLAYYTPGNHCNKLYRYLLGNKVQITHGLETTDKEFRSLPKKKQSRIRNMFINLYESAPLYLQLADNQLIVAHAGIKEELIGRYDNEVKTFVLYGDITGEKHKDGSPVRKDWAKKYNGSATIVYGHTPVLEVRAVNNTYNIDTGVVFGGKLTALKYPEIDIVQVPSSLPFIKEKFATFN